MEILGAIGGGSFVLASLVIGLRLLLLAHRTRQLPELAMGTALFLLGGMGYPIVTICRLVPLEPHMLSLLFGTFMVEQWFGITCLAVFNWRVFHSQSVAARNTVIALSAGMLSCSFAQGLGEGFAAAALDPKALFPQLACGFATLVLGWSGVESWRYHTMLRRRLALGLAEPLVADRFRLWAIASACAAVLTAVTNLAFLIGIDFAVWPPGALTIGVLGTTAACAVALAFLPPEWYSNRVRHGDPTPSAG